MNGKCVKVKELQRLSRVFPFWNYDLYKKFG